MINLEYEGLDPGQLREVYDSKTVDRALNKTINRVMASGRLALSREVRKIYLVKAADVKKGSRIAKKARAGDNEAILAYLGRRFHLGYFKPGSKIVQVTSKKTGKKIRRKGVTVRVTKTRGRVLIKSVPAFLVKGGTDVRYRGTAERESYKTPTVVSVPEMVQAKTAMAAFDARVSERFPVEFQQHMDYFLGRFGT